MYCSSKLLVPTVTVFSAWPNIGVRLARITTARPIAAATTRGRERKARPSSASASRRSITTASPAALATPNNTNTQFSVCSPVKM